MLPAKSASFAASIFEIVLRSSSDTILLIGREDDASMQVILKACSALKSKTILLPVKEKYNHEPATSQELQPQINLAPQLDKIRNICSSGPILIIHHCTDQDRDLLKQILKYCQKSFVAGDQLAVLIEASYIVPMLAKHVRKRFAEWNFSHGNEYCLLERTSAKQWKTTDNSLRHVIDFLKKDEIELAAETLNNFRKAGDVQGSLYLSSYCAFRNANCCRALELLREEIALFGSTVETQALGKLLLEKLIKPTDSAAFVTAIQKVFLRTELSFDQLRDLHNRAALASRLNEVGVFVVAGDPCGIIANFLAPLTDSKVCLLEVNQSLRFPASAENVIACKSVDVPVNIAFLYCKELVEGYASKLLSDLGDYLPKFNFIWLNGITQMPAEINPAAGYRLNLGCGQRVHADWVNLDLAPVNSLVIKHDFVHDKLPFADLSCEAVYHSHVLEHLPKDTAPGFIDECYRVLCRGGYLRVVVPDFEQAARLYLEKLEAALADNSAAQDEYDWMMLEMVDQLTRHFPGGQMLRHWKKHPMPAKDFIIQRMGGEVRNVLEEIEKQPALRQESGLKLTAAEVGAYRLGGEVHQWMYDRFSLKRLIENSGFTRIALKRAGESEIRGFSKAGFELDSDGRVRKPESLFLEAQKN